LTPALVQMASDWETWREFLTSSRHRSADVPWHYYAGVLVRYDGLPITLLWGGAMIVACARWTRADLLPALWVIVMIGFFQAYPLKAFNYLLPVIPALALLAGHAISDLAERVAPLLRGSHRFRPVGWATAAAVTASLAVASAPSLASALSADQFGGLREAARWLRTNAPANAGVMTLSNGSAQYVFTFYGEQPSYPFGRFNLATILPGGRVVPASPPPPGQGTPRDWVALWPRRLITTGAVSYLVFYTKTSEDPPEESAFSQTSTRRAFRQMIARYGGKLVHTVYRNHEARVWTYRLTKAAPITFARPSVHAGQVTVRGSGFARDAAVTATYHRRTVARGRTAGDGTVTLKFPLPEATQQRYLLVVTDERGNYASVHLPKPALRFTIDEPTMRLRGSGFAPHSPISISYFRREIARAQSDEKGRVSATLELPTQRAPRWFLTVADADGNNASVHLPAPTLRSERRGNVVELHASGFRPNEQVTFLYQGRALARGTTDARGRLSARAAVPAAAQPLWIVTVRGRSGLTAESLVRPSNSP
jgi:hypothetical protein